LKNLLLAVIICFGAISCHQNDFRATPSQIWTEDQKRKYFVDSFAYPVGSGQILQFLHGDTTKSFAAFLQLQYPNIHSVYSMDPLPYALEDEYVDTTRIDPTREWIRLVVDPFFELPYSIVLERKAGRSYLITKLTDGVGRYNTGQLILTSKQQASDSLMNSILNIVDSLGFWQMQQVDTTGPKVTDGIEWQVEAMVGGRYNLIYRLAPDGSSTHNAVLLAKLGNQLSTAVDLPTLVRACDKRRKWFTQPHFEK
jgi:hypothetical protein